MEKIIIANWKMQLDLNASLRLAKAYKKLDRQTMLELVVCPSEFALPAVRTVLAGSDVKLGAQNMFWKENGAYTGEVSAKTLYLLGCRYVLIGHSERRQYLGETNEMVNVKVKAALQAKLTPVICIGETGEQKRAKQGKAIIGLQLRKALEDVKPGKQKLIIAYEPIWAIGTGQAIKPQEAEEQHYYIYSLLERILGKSVARKHCRVIYGGSVDARNGSVLLDLQNVDGLLVGGASLNPKIMAKIK